MIDSTHAHQYLKSVLESAPAIGGGSGKDRLPLRLAGSLQYRGATEWSPFPDLKLLGVPLSRGGILLAAYSFL